MRPRVAHVTVRPRVAHVTVWGGGEECGPIPEVEARAETLLSQVRYPDALHVELALQVLV